MWGFFRTPPVSPVARFTCCDSVLVPMTNRSAEIEVLRAQRDALREALRSLVAHVKRVGGYLSPEDLEALWRAESVLVENGRTV